MANSCEKLAKYSKTDYYDIAWDLDLAEGDIDAMQELFDEIGDRYTPHIAKSIQDAIQDGTFNENWEIKSTEETQSTDSQFNMNGAKNAEEPLDSLGDFYFRREDGYNQLKHMRQRFFEDVISRTIYDKKTGKYFNPDTSSINNALYEYKIELMKRLWKFTGVSYENDIHESDFTKAVAKTLVDYARLQNLNGAEMYYDDYMILKKFNDLLNTQTPFIKLDAAFKNSQYQSKNMYIWDPSGTYRQSWTDSESTDIEKYTSPVVKQLADYFTTATQNGESLGVPIGFKTYCTIMSTMAIWLHENRLNIDVEDRLDDIRKHGLKANFAKTIDVYIKYASPSDNVKEILWGIKKFIFPEHSTIPLNIRNAFANQFFLMAKYAYMAYRQNYEDGELNINGEYLEDSFIDTKQKSLITKVQNRVWQFQKNESIFRNLLEKHGITCTSDNGVITILFGDRWGKQFVIKVAQNINDGSKTIHPEVIGAPETISNELSKSFIKDFLDEWIGDDYEYILQSLNTAGENSIDLFNTFVMPISILIAASQDGIDNAGVFDYQDNGLLKTYTFQQWFNTAAKYKSVADGINELNVLRNGEGNALPIYQLAPAIFDIFNVIDDLYTGNKEMHLESIINSKLNLSESSDGTFSNVNQMNLYVTHRDLLKKIVARSDVKIGNRVKSSDQLTVAEVASLAIFNDFWQNLNKTSGNLSGCILLQPITYSDKKTHFLPVFDIAHYNIGGESAQELFQKIVNPSNEIGVRLKAIEKIKNEICFQRSEKNKRQIYNQYLRFVNVINNEGALDKIVIFNNEGRALSRFEKSQILNNGVNRVALKNINSFDAMGAFKAISKWLENINSVSSSPVEILRAMFKAAGAVLNEDFDFLVTSDQKVQANETLYLNLIVFGTKQKLKNYIDEQKARFTTDLIEYGVTMDEFSHPELRDFIKQLPEAEKNKWYDPYSGLIRMYRSFKKNPDGSETEVLYRQDEIENGALVRPDIAIQLNPILEGYFYANMLFGSPFNDILFGGTEGYIPKNISRIEDFDSVDLNTLIEIQASRLSNEFKRTTFGGAVKRKYAQGLTFGVPRKVRFAAIEDENVIISTLRGDNEKQVAQDGSGWIMPWYGMQIQKSLVDSPVGNVRKTIAGYVDPRFGTQCHFKWAETDITQDLRQKSDGDGSVETIYRKCASAIDISDKFKKIKDLSIYYNPSDNPEIYTFDEQQITITKPIFRYSLETGEYYKLLSIKNDNGTMIAQWAKCKDKHGNIDNLLDPITVKLEIKTLYDIDQLLGGAWTYELDDNNNLQVSQLTQELINNIICTNDMKEDYIGIVVNHSALKAGAMNMNPYSVWNNDGSTLNHFYIDTAGFGVQMDADHELDFSSVTEMSQMISLLTQSGTNVDVVNQCYTDIGKVAAAAMVDIIAAVDQIQLDNNINSDKLYKILGKALIDTFTSGNKEELGLAQAFIRTAQKSLANEGIADAILPYSAESIKGSFITTVISLINKTGIRRKYAGFGGVQVPANRTMQHYYIDNVPYDYRGMRDQIRPILKANNITFKQAYNDVFINGMLNPFLQKVDRKTVEFEDTVVIASINLDGTITYSDPIYIKSFDQFDRVRNLTSKTDVVYKWIIRPRELAQSDIRITANGTTISEYDIDSVRSAFYLQQYLDWRKNPDKNTEWLFENERKKRVIFATITQNDLPSQSNININDIFAQSDNFIKQLKKLLITKSQDYFNNVSNIIKTGIEGTIQTQLSEVDDVVVIDDNGNIQRFESIISPEIRNITAQIVMGRKNFEKFGLRRGDRLSDIIQQGEKFFEKRLLELDNISDKLNQSQIPQTRYDAVLHLANGDDIVILVGENQDENLQYFSDNQDVFASDTAISYKGKVLIDNEKLKGTGYTVSDIVLLSYTLNSGETVPTLWLPDYNVLDRLSYSDGVESIRYNYNDSNYLDILKHKYPSLEDLLIHGFITEDGVAINAENILNENNILVDQLNNIQRRVKKANIRKKAALLYRNFIQQLNYIETRIPSQAMQSTMNIQVVDLADTDTNYIWVNEKMFKLQGSDLDIDKAYCMGYDIDESGNIYAMSDLIYKTDLLQNEDGSKIFKPRYSVDEVLLLRTPMINTNVDIQNGPTDKPIVNFSNELKNLITKHAKFGTILSRFLDKIQQYEGQDIVISTDGLDESNIGVLQQVIKDANIHNSSKRSLSEKEHALRNQVLAAARQIMNNPASQLDAETPIGMDEPKVAATMNRSLSSKEKMMTLDNAMSIFIMQSQNMSGKAVIAMTATGIKSYFIVTTYFNTLAQQLEQLMLKYVDTVTNSTGAIDPTKSQEAIDIANTMVAIFNELTFDGKLEDSDVPQLRTFANINFYNIKRILESLGDKKVLFEDIFYDKEYTKTDVNTAFRNYANNGSLHFIDIINHLDRVSNGNNWIFNNTDWEYFKVNAPDSLSALLSAATDNAKELILDKLNATVEFADIYTTLLSQGVPFMRIAKMMTNDAFRIVAKYSKSNIFDKNTTFFRIENAIDFVLNKKSIYVKEGLFEKYLTDVDDNLKGHPYKGFLSGLFKYIIKLSDTEILPMSDYILNNLLNEIKSFDSEITVETLKQNISKSDGVISSADLLQSSIAILQRIVQNPSNNKYKHALSKVIKDLFNNTEATVDGIQLSEFMKNTLLQHLRNVITVLKSKPIQNQEQIILDDYAELDFDPSEAAMDISEEDFEEMYASINTSTIKWFNGDIKYSDAIQMYRYAQMFFIPKTELWNALDTESKQNAVRDFTKLRNEILYAAKEMKMLGNAGSINQGMKTSDYLEYKRVSDFNKFINSAYMDRGNGEITEEFDLIRYLTETEPINDGELSYHDRHLAYYDKVKSAVNILRAFDNTANFKEMYNYVAISRKIIENSISVKLERSLINTLLKEQSGIHEQSSISQAFRTTIPEKDFKTVTWYVRDLLILNYFAQNGNKFEFYVPVGQQYWDSSSQIDGSSELEIARKQLTKHLDDIHDIATFKHLMDWYIIPKLQADPRFENNRFIKGLTLDRRNDQKSKEAIVYYRLQDSVANFKDSPKAESTYSDILTDFNKIIFAPIDSPDNKYGIGNWTIGNLFFIYNLLVNKDRIGGNTMTRLFEDLISSNNIHTIPYDYYKYISDLDKRIINIFDENGNVNTDIFVMDIRDLQWKLSDSTISDKYGVSSEINKGKTIKVGIKDSYNAVEQNYSPETDVDKLSDYVFGMKFLNGLTINKSSLETENEIQNKKSFNAFDRVTADSKSVFDTLTEIISESYGKEIPMEIFTEADIDAEFENLSEEERSNMKNSSGFIMNGNIYINGNKNHLEAPMHELMHFVAAAMKFSEDPEVRKSYYALLDWTTQWLDNKIKLSKERGKKHILNKTSLEELSDADLKATLLDKNGIYGNRHMSDIKEEILVTLLAREFKNQFSSAWGESRVITPQFIQANVKQALSLVLKSDKIKDIDFNDLGNTKLQDVLKKYASQILSMDSTLLNMSVLLNQELANLKDILIKNQFIKLSDDCL